MKVKGEKVRARLKKASVALSALCCVVWVEARAETVMLERRALPLSEGMEMRFQASQRRPRQDDFQMTVRVTRVERGADYEPTSARFRWSIHHRARVADGDESGAVTTTGLRRGRGLDAGSWRDMHDVVTEHTHLWLSRSACEALRRGEEARYAVDVGLRKDASSVTTLRRKGALEWLDVQVDGEALSVEVMRVTSNKNDSLTVLSDCRHALVLSAKVPGYYSWELKSIAQRRGH